MSKKSIQLGVIEGFYGRPWAPGTRLNMMRWLPRLGFDRYLYAPKADAFLRKRWRSNWPAPQEAHLRELAQSCQQSGLRLFVGLSPFRLYERYDLAAKLRLRSKVQGLCDLGVGGLALLFDDMPGGTEGLADKQLEIYSDIREWTQGLTLAVCPTYYSDDPILDRVFGQRPDDYLRRLGSALAADVELMWTGPEVCSPAVSVADLAPIAELTNQPLALWDNYPVNDSKTRSPHLYVQPLSGRTAELASSLASHWCNAMNQAALSLPALASLPALYGRPSNNRVEVFAAAGIDAQLLMACEPLAKTSLEGLNAVQKAALSSAAQSTLCAGQELREWLSGEYQFDPACLTD